ncbi:MAG: DUF1569 domain-containing protein [Niabella sp.]
MVQIFTTKGTQQITDRINQLTPQSQPQWGQMNVAQMLAHCNVTYELVYTDKHPRPKNPVMKWVLKSFVKKVVVNEEPYKKNMRTAPHFLITSERDFEQEKQRLIAHINKTQELGAEYFDGKESHSFGVLTAKEWNNMFAKHLDHHLSQFSV